MTTAQPATAQPAPAAAAAAAAAQPPKPGLDDFLREFDTAAPAPQPQPQPAKPAAAAVPSNDEATRAVKSIVEEAVKPLRAEAQRAAQERLKGEIAQTVEQTRSSSEFLKSVDPDIVEDFLQGLARKDQRFATAFMQRQQKPAEWQAVLKAAGEKLEEKLRPVAAAPTAQTRAAVLAASRVSTTAPREGEVGPDQVRKMNDREFREYKRRLAAGNRR